MNVLKLTKINVLLLLVTLTRLTTFLRDEGIKAADAERLGKCLMVHPLNLKSLKGIIMIFYLFYVTSSNVG